MSSGKVLGRLWTPGKEASWPPGGMECPDPFTDKEETALRGKVTCRQVQYQDWAKLAGSRIHDSNHCPTASLCRPAKCWDRCRLPLWLLLKPEVYLIYNVVLVSGAQHSDLK